MKKTRFLLAFLMIWGGVVMGWGQVLVCDSLRLSISPKDTVCNGEIVTLTVSGYDETTTFPSFQWTFGTTPISGNEKAITHMPPESGIYKVVVTQDNTSCPLTQNVTLIKLQFETDATKVTCYGDANGSITVKNVMGGSGQYSYKKDNDQSYQLDPVFYDLSPGDHEIFVYDAVHFCLSPPKTVTIIEPELVSFTTTVVNVTCSGNGQITVTPAGGNGNGKISNYTYSKDDGMNYQGSNVFTGLSKGPYKIKVKDSQMCESETTIETVGESALMLSLTKTDVICFGNATGTITATATGGSGNKTFSIFPTAGQQVPPGSGIFKNLPAGTYTITVAETGCSTTATETISQPPTAVSVTVETLQNATTCSGANSLGKLKANPIGGTPNYTYNWNSGLATPEITAQPTTYTVTVTDANGCTASNTGTIAGPEQFGLGNGSTTKTWCKTPANGTYTVVITQGLTASLTLKLNNVPFTNFQLSGNQLTLSGLDKNPSYTLVVTNANNCTAAATFAIAETPPPATPTTSTTPEICDIPNSGAAMVINPNDKYSYLWSNGETTSSINNLSQDTYTVTVTDENGCKASAVAVVGKNNDLSNVIAFGQLPNSICQGDGGISLVVTKPAPDPTKWKYSWSPTNSSAVSTTINTTVAGQFTYTLNLELKAFPTCNGSKSIPVVIKETPAPKGQDISICIGETLTLSPTGLNPDLSQYTFAWKKDGAPIVGASQNILNITQPGNPYSLDVTKAGCKGTANFNVTKKGELPAKKTIFHKSPTINHILVYPQDSLCYQWGYVSAAADTILLTGETKQYYFAGDKYSATYKYFVRISSNPTDCFRDCWRVVYLSDDAPILPDDDPTALSVHLIPNPNDGAFALKVELLERGPVDVQIFDVMGHLVESRREAPTESVFTMPFRLDDRLASGVYYLRLYDQEGSLLTVRPLVVVR